MLVQSDILIYIVAKCFLAIKHHEANSTELNKKTHEFTILFQPPSFFSATKASWLPRMNVTSWSLENVHSTTEFTEFILFMLIMLAQSYRSH